MSKDLLRLRSRVPSFMLAVALVAASLVVALALPAPSEPTPDLPQNPPQDTAEITGADSTVAQASL